MTQPIIIETVLDDNHEVVLKLPELDPGPVKITVEAVEASEAESRPQTLREALIAAGLYDPTIRYAPPDAKPLSEEERERLWKQMAGGKTALELIDEERF